MPCKEVSFHPTGTTSVEPSRAKWVLAATVLGSSMEFIDGTVVNVALPSLQRSFGATGTQVQWVVEAYALFLSSLLLVGGSLGDRFGLRKTFLTGVAIFAAASIWCGVSPSVSQLVVSRCLQGVGGALLVPNSLALLSANFTGAERGRAIGAWSGFASMMTALGPIVGGWMVQHGSWRWVFFLNAPLALTTIWITLSKIPGLPSPPPQKSGIDIKGAALATAGLSGLTFSLMEWSTGHITVRLLGLLGIALLVAFVFVERRAISPMMPVELFRSRTFSGANLLTFFLYAALAGTLFYLPMNLIQVQGYTPTQAGAAMFPLVLIMFLLSRWAGGLLGRYGARRPLIVGPLITAAGYALLARPGVGGSYWITYFPAMIMLGLGMTISVAPLTTVVMSAVPQGKTGAASGVNNAVSQTAALLALAISAPLFLQRFSMELTQQLSIAAVAPAVVEQVQQQKRRLGAIQTEDTKAKFAVDEAFVGGFRLIALLASAAAVSAGITAAFTLRQIEPDDGRPV
ncbi:MFS transporter [Acidobacterium sp. S8]|uniref:MFS transporter n=1 Tax=Acidobacterium sp. S8 TaxID=1641854 RepID=UPI001C204B09|nr:MFS transporter [Acidobacterium sp. S8]